jgi:hypothetical protein
MELTNLPDWIMAISAVIYTIGTLALWSVTRRSIEAVRDAFKLNFLLAVHSLRFQGRSSMHNPEQYFRDIIESQNRKKFIELLKRTFPHDYESLVPTDEVAASSESEKQST